MCQAFHLHVQQVCNFPGQELREYHMLGLLSLGQTRRLRLPCFDRQLSWPSRATNSYSMPQLLVPQLGSSYKTNTTRHTFNDFVHRMWLDVGVSPLLLTLFSPNWHILSPKVLWRFWKAFEVISTSWSSSSPSSTCSTEGIVTQTVNNDRKDFRLGCCCNCLWSKAHGTNLGALESCGSKLRFLVTKS